MLLNAIRGAYVGTGAGNPLIGFIAGLFTPDPVSFKDIMNSYKDNPIGGDPDRFSNNRWASDTKEMGTLEYIGRFLIAETPVVNYLAYLFGFNDINIGSLNARAGQTGALGAWGPSAGLFR